MRNIIINMQETDYALRNLTCEDIDHFFFVSSVIKMWSSLYAWTRFQVVFPSTSATHYLQHKGLVRGKKLKRSRMLLWHVVVWSIQQQRNNIIFQQGTFDSIQLMDSIKSFSWLWFRVKMVNPNILFSDWCINPSGYLSQ